MNKRGYDLICQTCLEMFQVIANVDLKTGERVIGGRCWRCLVEDSERNPVYRLVQTKRTLIEEESALHTKVRKLMDYEQCPKCESRDIQDREIPEDFIGVGVPVECINCGYWWVNEIRTISSSKYFWLHQGRRVSRGRDK